MSDRILVLPGTPQQFVNFTHVFGDRFVEVTDEQVLNNWKGETRPLVLLIGTWVVNPLRERVMDWVQEKGRDGRPRGQCFVMLGRAKGA